jgi:hypothetical protein
MKNILNLSLILVQIVFFMSCKNSVTKNLSTIKNVVIDTVVTGDPSEIKCDTIIKVSKPFELNGILCYWENHIVCVEENINQIDINLKNNKTKQTLLQVSLDVEDSVDYKSDIYFNKLNNDHFQDLNFDGFKDFYYFSKGSMLMTSLTNIYLFNNDAKSFEYSEYLTAISVDEIDEKARKLITTSFDRDYETTKTHYFDKSGKIKYTEVITIYNTDSFEYKTYEKIVQGKVIESKVDSTATE